MTAIADTLADLDVWLENNAPTSAAQLHPPAADRETAAAEDTLGLPFPDDLRFLYQWHNGSPRHPLEAVKLFPGFAFLALADSVDEWRSRNDLGAPALTWNRQWVPLGTDFGGDLLVLDLNPDSASHGRVFEANLVNGPMLLESWPTLGAMLDDVADALAATEPRPLLRGLIPVVEAQKLAWRLSDRVDRGRPPRRPPQP